MRVWDARAWPACTAAIDVWNGVAIPPSSRADQLRALRAPHVSCVRFDAGGGWLVAGSGNGSVTMWSLGLGSLAKQLDTGGCVPQVGRVVWDAFGGLLCAVGGCQGTGG